MAKTKVNVTMDEDLLKRVDDYADEHYTTRSGVVSLAVDQLVSTDELKSCIKRVTVAMESMAKGKELTAEERGDLETFRVLASVFGASV